MSLYFIANVNSKLTNGAQMMLYTEYHFLFLKNFHQMTMPRMASSRRMMPANIILFVKTLQKHSCLSLKPHYQWEKWAKGD